MTNPPTPKDVANMLRELASNIEQSVIVHAFEVRASFGSVLVQALQGASAYHNGKDRVELSIEYQRRVEGGHCPETEFPPQQVTR